MKKENMVYDYLCNHSTVQKRKVKVLRQVAGGLYSVMEVTDKFNLERWTILNDARNLLVEIANEGQIAAEKSIVKEAIYDKILGKTKCAVNKKLMALENFEKFTLLVLKERDYIKSFDWNNDLSIKHLFEIDFKRVMDGVAFHAVRFYLEDKIQINDYIVSELSLVASSRASIENEFSSVASYIKKYKAGNLL